MSNVAILQATHFTLENKKSISVVIPNYNGEALLPQILPDLYTALKATGLSYEVIVSDDCSPDGSVALLEREYPEVKLIKSKINQGFSPTINKGIFAAQYDLILLLNSDVKLTPDYFKRQLAYFDDKDTFGVMGRIIGWDDEVIQDGGKFPSFHGVKIKTSGNYIPEHPKDGDRLYSMYLSGANALVSREKIMQLGGFDELFAPFYVEDVELSLRAWRIGWKCFYEHNAVCRHKTSVTIKSKSSKTQIRKIYYRNKMFLHALHLQGGKLFLWHLQLIPETLIHFVTGRLWYFSSLKMFFSSGNKIRASKEQFQSLAQKLNGLLSVHEVVNKILISLKNIPVKRL
jgi:GT2 family glycosyltransferase